MIDTTQAEVFEPEVVTTPETSTITKLTMTATSTTSATTTSEKIIKTTRSNSMIDATHFET